MQDERANNFQEAEQQTPSYHLTQTDLLLVPTLLISPSSPFATLNQGASQVVLVVKNPLANAGDIRDMGSIPGLRRFPGGGHGNPVQYSCLENPTDRGAIGSQRFGHN